MAAFKEYSKYYNLLYKNKDYKTEAYYIDCLIKRYSGHNKKNMLDIGCGTGRHDLWFADKGYKIVGIDKSPEMIKIAKTTVIPESSNIKFHIADAARFKSNKKFDIAVALFHTMSYQITNRAFLSTLKNIYIHLKRGGLFIFDFWYGPAVLTQQPALRTKIVSDREKSIRRTAIPKIDIDADTVDVHYKISIKNRRNRLEKNISEHHIMRYFFLPELRLMLETTGFKVVKCLKWMSLREGLSEKSWSGVIIAKK